jgi:SpoVK/Ycf46/Vps4 family AAA+-type ATPase
MHMELSTKYNAEVKNSLRKCIMLSKPDISFDDIAGCEYAKECIKMAFVVPEVSPHLFNKNIRPW